MGTIRIEAISSLVKLR